MTSSIAPDWIAVDWGTTRLRAYAMQGAEAIAEASSEDGMAELSGGDFEAALQKLTGAWRRASPKVIACGMVGARLGWLEAPYLPAPCDLNALLDATVSPAPDVHIVPGLSRSDRPDVMRGEETLLLGLARLRPGFEGKVCLPGTHSKWVSMAGSLVRDFSTVMTGELFDLLATRSILRLTLGETIDPEGFVRGVEASLARPTDALMQLFSLRAEALLEGGDPNERLGRLSGMLIGAEIAEFAREEPVMLIGAPQLCAHYRRALDIAGQTSEIIDAKRAALAGLGAIRESFA